MADSFDVVVLGGDENLENIIELCSLPNDFNKIKFVSKTGMICDIFSSNSLYTLVLDGKNLPSKDYNIKNIIEKTINSEFEFDVLFFDNWMDLRMVSSTNAVINSKSDQHCLLNTLYSKNGKSKVINVIKRLNGMNKLSEELFNDIRSNNIRVCFAVKPHNIQKNNSRSSTNRSRKSITKTHHETTDDEEISDNFTTDETSSLKYNTQSKIRADIREDNSSPAVAIAAVTIVVIIIIIIAVGASRKK